MATCLEERWSSAAVAARSPSRGAARAQHVRQASVGPTLQPTSTRLFLELSWNFLPRLRCLRGKLTNLLCKETAHKPFRHQLFFSVSGDGRFPRFRRGAAPRREGEAPTQQPELTFTAGSLLRRAEERRSAGGYSGPAS